MMNVLPFPRSAYFRLYITVILLAPLSLPAQRHWKSVQEEFGKLPRSISVYKTTDSLNGRPFIAYFLSVRLKEHSIRFTTAVGGGKRLTPHMYYLREGKPVVVVNGTFFSFQTNQNLNIVVKEGRLRAYNVPSLKSKQSDSLYYPTRSAIGITKNRRADVAWIFTDTAKRWAYAFQQNPVIAKGVKADPTINDLNAQEPWEWWKVHTAIGGGPMLIQQGEIRITNKEEQMFLNGEQDVHPRTAMGYTGDGKLIILAIQGRFAGVAEGATLAEAAQLLQELGCEEALNLDGGGSSCMLVNGKETIKPSDKEGQRPVPGVFLITRVKK